MALDFNGYVTMKFVNPKQSSDTNLYLSYKSLSLNEEGQFISSFTFFSIYDHFTKSNE